MKLYKSTYIRAPAELRINRNQFFKTLEGERKMEMPNAGELLIDKTREATIREVIELTYDLVEQTPEIDVIRNELHRLLEK